MGRWFYLYLILDLYSRKIVGWEVHDTDHADHAAHLVRRTALGAKPVLHGDNGSTLKVATVLAMLNWLGVMFYFIGYQSPCGPRESRLRRGAR
jgi:putative transposase